MNQNQIDCLVSRATGETIEEIASRGFTIADPPETFFDPEPFFRPPAVIDWDEVDAQRPSLFP
jgi:hypothetical protein